MFSKYWKDKVDILQLSIYIVLSPEHVNYSVTIPLFFLIKVDKPQLY